MDLIGEFHPPSSKGNRYALMAVCMLTGFTFCIPIKSKKAEECDESIHNINISCVFETSKKILTDNGTEFKNKLVDRCVPKNAHRTQNITHLLIPV